jgi:hypothetical protein
LTFYLKRNTLRSPQVSKRLQQELMSLMMSNDRGISAFPDGDKLFSWIATVTGPSETVYEGKSSSFLLSTTFVDNVMQFLFEYSKHLNTGHLKTGLLWSLVFRWGT